MSQSFATIFRDGQHYMSVWPPRKELNSLFPEARVIAATKLALKVMPLLAVVSSTAMVNVYGTDYLPQAIAIAAFFLSMPLQGLMWLGHRSNQTLPPSMRQWYQEIHQKMQAQGCQLQAAKTRPRYIELAQLLKKAFEELDRVFTKQWF